MKLVEAESTGPVEGEDAIVTPPRPPHRRVSVSFLFTLSVLTATVVTIYVVFPARHNQLVTDAIHRHRDPPTTWDLTAPTPDQLRAWAIGVTGPNVPLPPSETAIVGARKIDVLHRPAALVELKIGDEDVTYIVQHARGIAPDHAEQVDGDVRAVAWRTGNFSIVGVGKDTTHDRWLVALGGH